MFGNFFEEFKKFAMRGNVMDMAVGVVVGAAFSKIVSSFVENVMMPPIGLLMGKIDFSNLFINLSDKEVATLAEAKAANAPVLAYGMFINSVIDFLIVAFAVFVTLPAGIVNVYCLVVVAFVPVQSLNVYPVFAVAFIVTDFPYS